MKPARQSGFLRRYLSGLSEHVFQTCLGIVDPSLADYISDLLVRFSRADQLQVASSGSGKSLHTLEELLLEARQRDERERGEMHRHIGDVALFWVGIFPESLRRSGSRQQLERYRTCGKHAYLAASRMQSDDVPGELLARLGNDFDICASGLHQIRSYWRVMPDAQEEFFPSD